MPTTKKRINLSVADKLYTTLARLAEQDSVTPTTKALELLRQAMEIEEDRVLGAIAKERDKKGVHYISHNAVWK